MFLLPVPSRSRCREVYPILQFTLLGYGVQIPSYTLFAAAGALTGAVTALFFLKREGLSLFRALSMLVYMACAFLIGARLFNFAVNPDAYGSTLQIYSLKFTGFSLYGGILGALSAFLVWTAVQRLHPLPLLDALTAPSALAFALARTGCFLNGCCGGKATRSFWGVVFPMDSTEKKYSGILGLFGKTNVAVYPTQLFEMSLALIGLVPVMWLYFRKKPRAGTIFLLYGMWFTAMRWAILPLRNLPYADRVTNIWLPIMYAALLLSGGVLLRQINRKRIKESTMN